MPDPRLTGSHHHAANNVPDLEDAVNEIVAVFRNHNAADQLANAADTYLTGSGLVIWSYLSYLLQDGATFRWRFAMTKTAAGVAAPVWSVRVGTAGSTADTARLVFNGPSQTAVVDAGVVEITAVLRNAGAAAVLAGALVLVHNLDATGFANIGTPTLQVTSAGFDTTVPDLIVGVSVNPGAAGAWTHQLVAAELVNS